MIACAEQFGTQLGGSAVVDGTVVEHYEYNAYGKATVFTDMNDWDGSTPTTRGYSAYGNPYLFTGRRLDSLNVNGLKLYHYCHRTYDTYTGRFMQEDPLMYIDGMSLYEYVRNNSLNHLDPLGLKCKPCTTYIGVICYALNKQLDHNLPDSIIGLKDLTTLLDYMGGVVQLANQVTGILEKMIPSLSYLKDLKVRASYRKFCQEHIIPCGDNGEWDGSRRSIKVVCDEKHDSGWLDNGMDGLVWPDVDRIKEVLDELQSQVKAFYPPNDRWIESQKIVKTSGSN